MTIRVKWNGIPAKFREVHHHHIEWWLREFLGGRRPECMVFVPMEPLGWLSFDSHKSPEIVEAVEVRAERMRRFDRSGPIETILTVSLSDRSRAVVDAWEAKHKDLSVADILWFPEFPSQESVA